MFQRGEARPAQADPEVIHQRGTVPLGKEARVGCPVGDRDLERPAAADIVLVPLIGGDGYGPALARHCEVGAGIAEVFVVHTGDAPRILSEVVVPLLPCLSLLECHFGGVDVERVNVIGDRTPVSVHAARGEWTAKLIEPTAAWNARNDNGRVPARSSSSAMVRATPCGGGAKTGSGGPAGHSRPCTHAQPKG